MFLDPYPLAQTDAQSPQVRAAAHAPGPTDEDF